MKYNKYSNRWTTCRQGHKHQSKMEARYCNELQILLKAKEIKAIEYQVPLEIVVKGQLICVHKVDFLVTEYNGTKSIHEVKGAETKDWIIKKKLIEVLYPQYEYNVIKSWRIK